MAVKDTLPSTNLGFTDMADTYGVARTADIGTMYKNGTINMFSKSKPTDMTGLFVDDPTGIDGDRSLTIPLWTDIYSNPPSWVYRRPTGGESSPYRGGDSAGYYRLARAFVTSGKVGAISFRWSLQTAPDGSSSPILNMSFTRPTGEGNLQPEDVKQYGEYLSNWYWSVLLKSSNNQSRYLFVAGNIQTENGITNYQTLGQGGRTIQAALTADMVDALNGGTATFFLWLPGQSIQGKTFDQIQLLIGSGKMVGVYAGVDPGSGDVWLNPVPLSLSRLSGNVYIPEDVNIPYDRLVAQVAGYAAFPVKGKITSGDSSIIDSRMNWDAQYTPDAIGKYFNTAIQTVENPRTTSRTVTLTFYNAKYNPEAINSIPAIDKDTVVITQAGKPMSVTFNPTELVIEGMMTSGNVFFDCPTDGKWYVLSITESASVGSGGNHVSWVSQLTKLGTQDGVISENTNLPVNPDIPAGYTTGPAYVSIQCDPIMMNQERVAYIHISHSGGYNTLKITQKAKL